jgi:prepilin-type N-terminal cleavage/methylation domain-containing protein
MKNQKGYTVVELTIVIAIVLTLVVVGTGWVKNLIKLARCDFEAPYKAEIIHSVGLLPPVGMVTGWMDLGK